MDKKGKVYVILHNVRSVHNVASIFRTADCAGVSKLYLTGITPSPLDRFGRARRDFANVSLGAEKTVPWEYIKSARVVLRRLRKEGAYCAAVEQSPRSRDYRRIPTKKNTAFFFGNEVKGLPRSLLREVDVIAEIPMRGAKESLNVSVAAGIILFSNCARQ